ncbi:MAG: hypothetical protein H0T50_01880 [Gemmatimonadales bacterium]|nr:hypothetical protein [Gemmatimonadales bacterium]
MTLPSGPAMYAQSTAPASPAYAAVHLHCARFAETSRSDIETETARGAVKATAERDGIWSFRARDSSGGVVLESWYDSLSLRRRSGESEVAADTDGLIGGRYRGLLRPAGGYVEIGRPFLPEEVAEVADLSGAARDLLPPLPTKPLEVGESWKDAGLEVSRLQDTVAAGRPLLHFRLEARGETREVVPRGDTTPIPVRQTTVEQGDIFWSPRLGLVRRTRDITTEATIPSGGRIRQPVRSRVAQRVELTRLPSRPACK